MTKLVHANVIDELNDAIRAVARQLLRLSDLRCRHFGTHRVAVPDCFVNERCWIEPVTQMQRGYETRKSKNGKTSDSDSLLEPGVTVA
jgi:hypothetical protein